MHYILCVRARMFIYVVRIGLCDKVRLFMQKVQNLPVHGASGRVIVKHLRVKTVKVLPVLRIFYRKTVIHIHQHILVCKLAKSALQQLGVRIKPGEVSHSGSGKDEDGVRIVKKKYGIV